MAPVAALHPGAYFDYTLSYAPSTVLVRDGTASRSPSRSSSRTSSPPSSAYRYSYYAPENPPLAVAFAPPAVGRQTTSRRSSRSSTSASVYDSEPPAYATIYKPAHHDAQAYAPYPYDGNMQYLPSSQSQVYAYPLVSSAYPESFFDARPETCAGIDDAGQCHWHPRGRLNHPVARPAYTVPRRSGNGRHRQGISMLSPYGSHQYASRMHHFRGSPWWKFWKRGWSSGEHNERPHHRC